MSEIKDIRFVFESQEACNDASNTIFNGNRPIPKHFEHRFKSAPKTRIESSFGNIEQKDWQDWRWQQRKRFRNIEQLESIINVTEGEKNAFLKSDEMFHMGDRKSTRLNSSHIPLSRMPSSA